MHSCLWLCDPMDYSPPSSSVHGIFQARLLEWVAILFWRGSSRPRNQTRVSCIAGRFFTAWATREANGWVRDLFFKSSAPPAGLNAGSKGKSGINEASQEVQMIKNLPEIHFLFTFQFLVWGREHWENSRVGFWGFFWHT